MRNVRVLRVDPYRRTVATLFLRGTRDATPQIRRLTRANNLGSRVICQHEGQDVMCVAGLDIDESMKGWRMVGGEDTAGVAILTGRSAENILIAVPISREWLLERLHWLEGEDVGGRDLRADDMLPSLNADVRRAIEEAIVLPKGEIWITAANKALAGPAMITLGLGTERTGGQMLTKLGETMFDKLGQAVDGPETR